MDRPDARALLWVALLAFATGVPLMVAFGGASPVLEALRALHAASSFVLVAATLLHVVGRLGAPATRRGLRTGALAMLAVAIAAVSGALSVQPAGDLLAAMGLAAADGQTVWFAMAHVAYASLIVALTLVIHVRGTTWVRLLGRRTDAMAAAAATGFVAVLAMYGVAWTTWLVPPVPVLWAWSALVAVGLYGLSPWLARPGSTRS